MQIKATVGYHLTPVRMTITKNLRTRNAGEDMENRYPLHCWWECKLVQPLWRITWRFLKKLEIELLYDAAIPLLCIYLEKTVVLTYMHPSVPCSTVYDSQDMETA